MLRHQARRIIRCLHLIVGRGRGEHVTVQVGIDANSWLQKGAYSCSMQLCLNLHTEAARRYLNYFMHRIDLLRHHKITPVVVFDGGDIPCKSATSQDRYRRRESNLELAREKLKQGDVQTAVEFFQVKSGRPWRPCSKAAEVSGLRLRHQRECSLSRSGGGRKGGIQNLLRFMKPFIDPVHIKKYTGQRVVIDAHSWLHKGAHSCSMELCLNPHNKVVRRHLNYFMHRIDLLRHHKITPVIVFDGGDIPCKSATSQDRYRQALYLLKCEYWV